MPRTEYGGKGGENHLVGITFVQGWITEIRRRNYVVLDYENYKGDQGCRQTGAN